MTRNGRWDFDRKAEKPGQPGLPLREVNRICGIWYWLHYCEAGSTTGEQNVVKDNLKFTQIPTSSNNTWQSKQNPKEKGNNIRFGLGFGPATSTGLRNNTFWVWGCWSALSQANPSLEVVLVPWLWSASFLPGSISLQLWAVPMKSWCV